MNFNETIPYLFAQISTAFKISIEKQLIEIELHSGQVFILFELWKTNGLSQIDLSNKLKVSPPTINKMVKSLAKNEFVICNRCQGDGRMMRVFLTQKGFDVRPTVEEQWGKIELHLLSNLTETEKLVLFQLFVKLRDYLLPESK
jgi:MarR family transcriptional regulator, organic hydroperoxide resistance regulator